MATAATRSFPYDAQEGSEDDWREMFTDAVGSGVIAGKANEGVVTAGSGRQVLVATLHGWVGGAFGAFDAQTALALTANAAGSTVKARVVLRNNYTTNQIELDVIYGSAGGAAPTLTDNSSMKEISLAQVALASGYTNVNSGNITDERTVIDPFGVSFATSTMRDIVLPAPSDGQTIYLRSTSETLVRAGTAWRKPWNLPWGQIGYIEITADVLGVTNLATITGLSSTVSTVVGRRLHVTVEANGGNQNATGNTELLITQAAAIVQRRFVYRGAAGATGWPLHAEWQGTATSSGITYTAAIGTSGTTFDVYAGAAYPAFIRVVDIGPASGVIAP